MHTLIPGIKLPARVESIVNALFPTRPPREGCTVQSLLAQVPDGLFTEGEIKAEASALPNRKAPGPDNISNLILNATDPKCFQRLYNRCLIEKRFPMSWKIGKLFLIPKLEKPLESPSAYRPICLLHCCGK